MAESHGSPLVSAIINFLNAEQFIEEAIESVLSQTYRGWELLLVDDGSSDGSTTIARRYAQEYPGQVRYLEHPGHANRGKSASRNLGIRQSRGKLIAFLDADDVWMPQKLEQQIAMLAAYPAAAMVYGLDQSWYSWTGRPEDAGRDFTHELGVPARTLLEPPTLILLFFLQQIASIPNPSSILVRREIIDKVGGFVDDAPGIQNLYEDQAFYAKVCLNAPVVAAEECWDRYRQHPQSSTSVAQEMGQERSARLFFLNWLAGYLSERGALDRTISRALRLEIWRTRHPTLSQQLKRCQSLLTRIARASLPLPLRRWLRARWMGVPSVPPVGRVRFGTLRRLTPISREFGYDRGQPIDRYYIEKFLSGRASDIGGHVLEIGDDTYTRRFGGHRVVRSDVLDVQAHPGATIVADLTRADHLPSDTFDCVILTQTLQFIYDVPAALRSVRRILKPGGTVLVTVPGITPVNRYDLEYWNCYWSFTTLSVRRLFEEVFSPDGVRVEAHGNVLAASAFLYGMATEELEKRELDVIDPDFQLVITVRAMRPA